MTSDPHDLFDRCPRGHPVTGNVDSHCDPQCEQPAPPGPLLRAALAVTRASIGWLFRRQCPPWPPTLHDNRATVPRQRPATGAK